MISTSQLNLILILVMFVLTLWLCNVQTCPIIKDNSLRDSFHDRQFAVRINVIIITARAFICHKSFGWITKILNLLAHYRADFALLCNPQSFVCRFYCRAVIALSQQSVFINKWKNFSREFFPHLTSLSASEKHFFHFLFYDRFSF